MTQKTLDEKINDAACKVEELAALVHCITEKVEARDFDFKLYHCRRAVWRYQSLRILTA